MRLHALRLRQRVELLLRAVEPDHVEVLAEELAVAAVQEQLHVREVRVDVRALQLLIERVDERLHLLAHAARRAAARDAQTSSVGLFVICCSVATKPGGTVRTATILPSASSRLRLVLDRGGRASTFRDDLLDRRLDVEV